MKSDSFNDAVFISVVHNGKNAIVKYGDATESTFKKSSYTKKYVLNSNYACLTGYKSNVTVVDIDFTNVKKYGSYEDNEFYKKFSLDMLNNFNTYTVKTPNSGSHYYFEYDSEIATGKDIKSTHVDIRNDGGYIMTPPSSINGNSYEVVSNKNIIKMPKELRDWIIENQGNDKTKTVHDKETKAVKYVNETAYKCNIDNKTMLKILSVLPEGDNKKDSFVGDLKKWLNVGKGCKWANCFEAFNTWSKSTPYSNYNENDTCRIWNSLNCNMNNFLYILKYAKVKDTFTYKGVSDSLNVNKEINRGKIDNIKSTKRFFKSKYNYVLKSDTGTGKTRAFLEYIKANPSTKFISIVSRVELGNEQHSNLKSNGVNCEIYTDQTFKYGDNIIITPESSVLLHNYDFSNYVIFLDEFNSITEHLLSSSTLNKRRKQAFTTVCHMLKTSKQFIAVDADISQLSQSYLNYLGIEYKLVKNIYQNFKNKVVDFFNDEEDLLDELKKEKKFILCCDTKATADIYYKLLNDKSIKLITSDTPANIGSLSQYDKIIMSPKVIYGNDSQNLRPVYAVYGGLTITPYQMVQQITRERQLTKVNIFFKTPKSKRAVFDDAEQCEMNQVETLGTFKDAYNVSFEDYEDIPDILNDEYENIFNVLHTQYVYKMDCLATNPKLHLVDILESRGFEVNFKPSFVKETTNAINKVVKEDIQAELLEGFDINDEKYAKINKILKVPEEYLEEYKELFINKYELQKHFNYCAFFYQDISIIQNKLLDTVEYDIKKMKSVKTKILFMDKLEKMLKIPARQPFEYIASKDKMNTEDIEFVKSNYKNLFNRGTCKVETYNDAYTIYTKAIKNVCGELGERKKKQTNKVRFKNLLLDDDKIGFHKRLYDFRH